jgi:two-component system sensor histidine kinase RegB
MSETNTILLHGRGRSNWIRLRTLILLRWVAILGQLAAITFAQRMYNLQLEFGLCYLAIGVSVIGNLIAIFVFPENKRLTESENFLMVLFDLLQLSFLLYLTGGLHNPFAILLLAPVTISASVLGLRSTLIIGGGAIMLVTLLATFHIPLRTGEGFVLRVPDIFIFGNWAAITIATLFIGAYSRRVSQEIHSMADAVAATQMALSREQKLTDLGGVVAAAAHELGTPLATIKLASSELIEELEDRPDLVEDARLIREQADRCRDILRGMGRAGKDDLHLRQAPLSAVVAEAAEPHMDRGKRILTESLTEDATSQPMILRKPEIIHGLRNLVQNAVDFAHSTVWIETQWSEDHVIVRIQDDGQGYAPAMIGRIGDPFVRRRRVERRARPEYEGMGLGLFIAKTLLERTGAELKFANGPDRPSGDSANPTRSGALVHVVWPRLRIAAHISGDGAALGQNQPITI